eukprot:TRINITY_DN724_c0_g1_i3.p1 TRINITY_DN724_c0_g1~~TRINITY_DN724_c0_g1_i3.p1  ORF type:complete len:709 (+),score=137.89 TRINITY_DN724_c0_g1_i3:744-2870(+)
MTESLCTDSRHALALELGNGFWNPLPLRFWGHLNLRDYLAVGERPQAIAYLRIVHTHGSIQNVVTGPCNGSAAGFCWKQGSGSLTANDIYLGIKYDANLAEPSWADPAFDDSTWAEVAAAPPSPLDDHSLLLPNPLPPVSAGESFTAIRTWTSPNSTGVYVADMGRNYAGTISLRVPLNGVALKPGQAITLRYGELLNPDGSLNVLTSVAGQIKSPGVGGPCAPDVAYQTDSYIATGKESSIDFTPYFTWHGFQFAEIDLTGLNVVLLPEMVTGYVLRVSVVQVGTFESSNQLLNRIWQLFVRTLSSNMMGVQSDCPHRERFGYGGDLLATCESAMLVYDMSAFYRKCLLDFVLDQRENGGFTECAPYNGISDNGLGGQSGPIDWQSVVPQLALLLYRHYGDATFLDEAYPAMQRFIELALSNITSVEAGLGDWMTLEPSAVQLTGLGMLHADLVSLADIAHILEKDDASRYRDLAAQLAVQINSDFLDVDTGVYAAQDGSWSGTQCSQSMPLFMGLAPNSTVPAIYDTLLGNVKDAEHIECGMFGIKWLLMTLANMGDNSIAYSLATQDSYPSYGYMLKEGASTIWESWFYSDNTYSHNHPMFGSVAQWMIQALAGIQLHTEAVGFDQVIVAPLPVPDLTYVKGTHNGIACSWTLDGKSLAFVMNVTLPVTVKAHIRVPTDFHAGYVEHVVDHAAGTYHFESVLLPA